MKTVNLLINSPEIKAQAQKQKLLMNIKNVTNLQMNRLKNCTLYEQTPTHAKSTTKPQTVNSFQEGAAATAYDNQRLSTDADFGSIL